MYNECIICSEEVKNKTNNKYLFYQKCNCFFNNIHDECFIKWIDKKGTCILCHQPIFYKTIHRPFTEYKKEKTFIKKIFSCCIK